MLPVPPPDPLPRARERPETIRTTTPAALPPLATRPVVDRGIETWPQSALPPDRQPAAPMPVEPRSVMIAPGEEAGAGAALPPSRSTARGALFASAAAYGAGSRATAAPSSASLDLSPVARALMTAVGSSATPGSGALVHVSAPLVARPPGPVDVRELSAALAIAIEDSGLFYEAHLAQWVAGDRSTDRLKREAASRAPTGDDDHAATPAPSARAPSDPLEARRELTPAAVERVSAQLALLDTGVLRFAGEAWPGQRIDIEIVDPRNSGRQRAPAASGWKLTLALATPSLGELEVALSLDGGMLALNVAAASNDTRSEVRRALPALRRALAARDLAITALALTDGPD